MKIILTVLLVILIIFLSIIIILYCKTHKKKYYNSIHRPNRKYSHKKIIVFSNKNKSQLDINFLKNKLRKQLDNIDIDYSIILYYHDKCHHCTDFKPLWFDIKKRYENKINFVERNCTYNNPNLEYVTSFPTIVISKNGSTMIYDGNRNELEKYIMRLL